PDHPGGFHDTADGQGFQGLPAAGRGVCRHGTRRGVHGEPKGDSRMSAYYNEFDPYAAQWLRNLIDAGLIPKGDVDERSIVDVQPSDLAGYRQCHFFAGIGGWALAARLAGWPDDRELWTGSPPCQPFSVAGKRRGQDDERHLWPHLFRLASARRPAVLMGEQVAAAVGKNWLDGVFADLEGIGYACGAVVVPACAVDAPHRRDRLWFVARSGAVANAGRGRCSEPGAREVQQSRRAKAVGGSEVGAVADPDGAGREQGGGHDQADGHGYPPAAAGDAGRDRASAGAVADAEGARRQPIAGSLYGDAEEPAGQQSHGDHFASGRCESSAWSKHAWIIGHDGKARRVEPGIRLLAHGVSGRMAVVRPGFEGRAEVPEALHWYSRRGALKGFGNAIVPQVAAEVIAAYMEAAA